MIDFFAAALQLINNITILDIETRGIPNKNVFRLIAFSAKIQLLIPMTELLIFHETTGISYR
jgi:hypothetical protein